MPTYVAKFGGTSVENPIALHHVTQILKNNPRIRIVVVSAIASVTQTLLDSVSPYFEIQQSIIRRIINLHQNFLNNINYNDPPLIKLFHSTLHNFQEFSRRNLLNPRELDHWLSFGEFLSSILVTLYLKKNNLPVMRMNIQNILKTDNTFGQAQPLLDKIKENCAKFLLPELENNIIILQGFTGQTLSGETTTLGRGGSDYSAGLISEGIQADKLFIYKDVNGLYTADPKHTPQAELIQNLTFDQIASLANMGIKVLHKDTTLPCARKNIPIFIGSTFDPSCGGTLVSSHTNNQYSSGESEIPINQRLETSPSI